MIAPALSPEPSSQQLIGPAPIRASVLLAECDAMLRTRLVTALGTLGYAVMQVTTGPALLAEIERFALPPTICEPPAAIISAVRLPGLNGIEVISFLRCMRSSLPVIFMTAHRTPALRREAERLRAVALLDKPVSVSLLCTLLRGVISWSR